MILNGIKRKAYVHHLAFGNIDSVVSHWLGYLIRDDNTARHTTDNGLLERYFVKDENEGRRPNYLFDPHWYRRTYGYTSRLIGPLLHYVWKGEKQLRDPSPYFSTRYYVEKNNDVCLHGAKPLAHYLSVSGREMARRASPLINELWCSSQYGSAKHLADFVSCKRPITSSPHPAVLVSARARAEEVRDALFDDRRRMCFLPFGVESIFTRFPERSEGTTIADLRCGDLVDAIREFEAEIAATDEIRTAKLKIDDPISRQYRVFDAGRAEKLTRSLIYDGWQGASPLVSVIMPARNRALVIGSAIRSVLDQTYRNLELIVVDDGSTDATAAVSSAFADDRVRVIHIPASGVSVARNTGLEAAKGDFIAYLNSDNTWLPTHLQVMLAFMHRKGASIAHAALRVYNPRTGNILFRGAPYDRDAIDRENYIDMNVIVHTRRIVDDGHRFDAALRRCVDWDFIRRICLVSGGSTYLPVVGCNYLDEDTAFERITSSELIGDFYKLSIRQINLAPHLTGTLRRREPTYTIIWPLCPGEEETAFDAVWSAMQHLRFGSHELIIVNNNLSTSLTALLAAQSGRVVGLRVIHLWRTFMGFPAANLAARIARGQRLLFWSAHVKYDGAQIEAFMAANSAAETGLRFPAVVTQADRLAPGLFQFATDGSELQPVLEGQLRDRRVTMLENLASLHFPAAVTRDSFLENGGFDTDFALRLGLAEYASRCMSRNEPVAVHFDHPMEIARAAVIHGTELVAAKEAQAFRDRVILPTRRKVTAPGSEIDVLAGSGMMHVVNGRLRPSPRTLPFLSRAARGLKIQIMCPAPNNATLQAWGDYHFASSLAEALRRLGHDPVIRLRHLWDKPSPKADVAIHLRGIVDTRQVQGAINLLWIISHPDKITADEVQRADAVLVPSERACEALRRKFGVDALIMPQATELGQVRLPRGLQHSQFDRPLPIHWELTQAAAANRSRCGPGRAAARDLRGRLELLR